MAINKPHKIMDHVQPLGYLEVGVAAMDSWLGCSLGFYFSFVLVVVEDPRGSEHSVKS